ncbi:MAG: MreB/Mrl family cell shape determining protein [Armatimonadia bacterium]|nr:MreB/Mrl family cell shape determining protein [Armatimonadia bacterium]
MNGWTSRLSKSFGLGLDMGIDLGTSNILVWVRGEGLVLNEPSVVAVEKGSGRVLQVGVAAHDMLGKTPGNIVANRPLRDGVIADYTLTQRMLAHIIRRVAGKRLLFKPQIVLSVPSGVTSVERRAVIQAAQDAGAKRAFPIEEPMAAAIGAGLPIESAGGNMVIDIGGGTTDQAVISLGGAVISSSVRVAGYGMDLAIIRHIRRIHNLMVGERTAEDIKIQIGSAFKLDPELTMSVRGRDMVTGLPRTVTVHSAEVREALMEPVGLIVERVKALLEQTPPELGADIIERGIVLTGGGALLRGLERLLSIETSIPVRIAEDPMLCVVRGTGKALEHIDAMAFSIFEPPPPTVPTDL